MGVKYDVVYADPPWNEQGAGKCKRGADRHYPLMTTDAIAALPVRDLAAENAHLYLWVTNNFLPDGLVVMEAWGFRYITLITWFKGRVEPDMFGDDVYRPQIGIGQYFRGVTESCLFGVRGMFPYRIDAETGKRRQGVTGFVAQRWQHSRKPDDMRQMIERVSGFPEARKLELFARRPAPGWDVWGNEVASADRYTPL